MSERRNTVFKGAVILVLSGIFVKVLGMFYKIPLTNLIGDSGMGYFGSAYTVYTLFYTLSTAGVPTALALLVSEKKSLGDFEGAKEIYKTSLKLFLLIGLLLSAAMAAFSGEIASLIGNSLSKNAIMAAAPAVFFICGVSAFRGYFQGCKCMEPTAISQVIEASGKLLFGLFLAREALLSGKAIHNVAAYAVIGLSLSSGMAFLFLLITSLIKKDREFTELSRLTRARKKRGFFSSSLEIIKTAFPITLSSSVMTLASVFDLVLVMNSLQKIGYSSLYANTLYGNYTSLAVPLFNMPTSLVIPIALSITPYIRAAKTNGDSETVKKFTERTVRITSLIAMPAAIGMAFLSKPILSFIYTNEESVRMAHTLLTLLAPSIFFLSLLSSSNLMLQAMGRIYIPVIAMGVGALLKCVTVGPFTLRFGMSGAPLSTLVSYAVSSLIAVIFTVREAKVERIASKIYFLPLLCALLCGVSAFTVSCLTANLIEPVSLILSIGAGGIIYIIAAVLCGLFKGLYEKKVK